MDVRDIKWIYPITQRLPTRTSDAKGPGPDVPSGILHSVTQQLLPPVEPSWPTPPLIPSVHFMIMPVVGSTCARIDELTLRLDDDDDDDDDAWMSLFLFPSRFR